MKIYGPYLRKDGRKHIIKIDETGKRQTQSYPRFLMEKILDRKLLEDEEVDHKDNDFSNENIFNLQVLTKKENLEKQYKNSGRFLKISKHICPECNCEFTRQHNFVKSSWKKGKRGPFCSKICAGKFSRREQLEKA